MSGDSLPSEAEDEQAQQAAELYQSGRAAFERGGYRESVELLSQARTLVPPDSSLGGEIQIWLVTAYEAVGRHAEAIALGRELHQHSSREIRKQSRRLVYILEAPQLNRPQEWLTQIPDLSGIEESDLKARKGGASVPPTKISRSLEPPKPPDLSQVETADNQFIWVALVTIALVLGSLIWLS
jgi:tetratricopeptide (TPR) repeat protein